MDLSDPPRRPRREAIVPMINVVFLLLIFFLMTSRLAEPEPFVVTPPEADLKSTAEADPVVFVDATGRMHYDGHEGPDALAHLTAIGEGTAKVQLRADAKLEAKALARILRNLAEAGLSRAELVVGTP